MHVQCHYVCLVLTILGGGKVVANIVCLFFVFFLVEDFGGNICYEMYGVVNHYGSIHSGHYAAFIKHYASGTWFAISDDE